jgi:hypothetical protein
MQANSERAEAVSVAARLLTAVLLSGLLVLVLAFPHWVGLFSIGQAHNWRFLPLLAPAYSEHLLSVSAWLTLLIVLDLRLASRGRWDLAARWLELAAGAIGAFALWQIATGPPVLGPQPAWMDFHGWPAELQAAPESLVRSLYPPFRIALMAGSGVLLVISIRRLTRIPGLEIPAQKLVREGLGDRGVAGTLELFRQDAGRAYDVLERDQPYGLGPERPLARFLHHFKVVLHGIAVQLTPARRLLFVASMLLAIPDRTRWIAVAGLFFLLLLELVDRIRVRDELDLARELQRDLLPRSAPDLPGWVVAHSYRTASAIGGDYHDFQRTADGRLALVVGDASGHGMAAALIMAIANATLKAAFDHETEPVNVVTRLNRALVRTGGRKAFMTLFYGLLDLDSGLFDYVCAGHPFPQLRRADGRIVELGAGSLPLGMAENLQTTAMSVVLEPDDRLLLYSDGVPEALSGPQGEAFGFDRLQKLLVEAGTAHEIHDRILGAFDAHVGDQPLADDLTLVVLHRLPGATGEGGSQPGSALPSVDRGPSRAEGERSRP